MKHSDPIFSLGYGDFTRLAAHGCVPADDRPFAEVVRAIAAGQKPATFIHIDTQCQSPRRAAIATKSARAAGLTIRLERGVFGSGRGDIRVCVGRDHAAIDRLIAALDMPESIVRDIALGRALGYSDADITAFVQRCYGYAALVVASQTVDARERILIN